MECRHLFLKRRLCHALARVRCLPYIKFLHPTLSNAHSRFRPSKSKSCFTHSPQIFLPLPLLLILTTSRPVQDTQSSSLLCSICPNVQTIQTTHWIPKRLQICTALPGPTIFPTGSWAVAYLGFHKGGPNFLWPLVLTQRGPNQVLKKISCKKKNFFAKGGPWPNGPPKYATVLEGFSPFPR